MADRFETACKDLPLGGLGLEIAPLFKPLLAKDQYRVMYTDYTTAEELRQKNKNNTQAKPSDIVDIDFVWHPGKHLRDCTPAGLKFDYAVASHVIEHVPNPIDWLSQILEVLDRGGVLSLVVPDKKYTFDAYRNETQAADLIDAWMQHQVLPSPRQIYDCLGHAVSDSGNTGERCWEKGVPFENAKRLYSNQEAFNVAFHSWRQKTYTDIHCNVFTPSSFVKAFKEITELGILNIQVSDPIESWGEFAVKLTYLGPPKVARPISTSAATKIGNFKARIASAMGKKRGKRGHCGFLLTGWGWGD